MTDDTSSSGGFWKKKSINEKINVCLECCTSHNLQWAEVHARKLRDDYSCLFKQITVGDKICLADRLRDECGRIRAATKSFKLTQNLARWDVQHVLRSRTQLLQHILSSAN